MINFSAFPASVVALRLSFPLFLIVLVLSYVLRVPAVVNDGVLRLCEVENSLLYSTTWERVSFKSPIASPKKAL